MIRGEYLEQATATSTLASQAGMSARTLPARCEEIKYLKILQGGLSYPFTLDIGVLPTPAPIPGSATRTPSDHLSDHTTR